MIPILYMYSKKDYDRLMHGHEDLAEDEEPKKKKISLKQLFDGVPKIIKKKKNKKEQPKNEKSKLIQK